MLLSSGGADSYFEPQPISDRPAGLGFPIIRGGVTPGDPVFKNLSRFFDETEHLRGRRYGTGRQHRRRVFYRCSILSAVLPTVDPYCPVPPTTCLPFFFRMPSRREICPYRPVPPSKPAPTVPSRCHYLPIPSRPVSTATPSPQDAANTRVVLSLVVKMSGDDSLGL